MSGLSLDEVQALLDRISYKPGWEFRAMRQRDPAWYHEPDGAFGEELLVVVTYPAPDGSESVTARHAVPWAGEQVFLHWFRAHVLARTEDSEIDKWFRYDGVLVRDPHGATEREKADGLQQ